MSPLSLLICGAGIIPLPLADLFPPTPAETAYLGLSHSPHHPLSPQELGYKGRRLAIFQSHRRANMLPPFDYFTYRRVR